MSQAGKFLVERPFHEGGKGFGKINLFVGALAQEPLEFGRVTSQQQGRRQLPKVGSSCLLVVLTIIDPV